MEPIYLLRNLLRQASILFDDVARAHTAKLIVRGFRRNQKLEDAWTIHERIKKGRQALLLLQQANAGESKSLGRVLDLAYGRDGHRRHELLQPILDRATSSDPLIPGVPRTAPPPISDELMALMKHQVGTTIHRAEPEIPKFNAWGRPMPKRRVANMLRRHREYVLARLLPPLPEEMIQKLERFVRGAEEPVPPRRKIKSSPDTQNSCPKLSPRFKRRAYKKIVTKTPLMSINGKTQKPIAYWSDIVKGPPIEIGKLWDFEGLKKPEMQKPGKGKAKRLEEGPKGGSGAIFKAGEEISPNQRDGEAGSLKGSEVRVFAKQEKVPGRVKAHSERDGKDRGPKEPEERVPAEQGEVSREAKDMYREIDGEDRGPKDRESERSKKLDGWKTKGK
ncbi:hypothetical protein C7212DRAFT_186988 [Tuber magnatum]|uniref:LYR motif-containing protein Cup1-like N-terminal domain-containing protein n=1 Tax=Tuber magnatum TaxID=42249 RepID=A0A317STG9_9PEZI|nr:hypothetical protein C7212DRAFT_186988 [Tuber magnatum]